MTAVRIVGAGVVAASCSLFGFRIAWEYLSRASMLRAFITALEQMEARLAYDRCPLPELTAMAAETVSGPVSRVVKAFSENLFLRSAQEISGCMKLALESCPIADDAVRHCLILLGSSLGKLDYDGQLQSLKSLRITAENRLHQMEREGPQRVRCYRTLGVCGGIALAVLLV